MTLFGVRYIFFLRSFFFFSCCFLQLFFFGSDRSFALLWRWFYLCFIFVRLFRIGRSLIRLIIQNRWIFCCLLLCCRLFRSFCQFIEFRYVIRRSERAFILWASRRSFRFFDLPLPVHHILFRFWSILRAPDKPR